MDIKDLSEEFPKEEIHWRIQGKPYERNGIYSARALAYIDARDVMDRLDSVCGPENWQDEYIVADGGLIICRIGVKIGDQWVWKSDGAGETAVEGKKGGVSDALKRAAVKWGIGRYLYRLDSPYVPCDVNVKGSNVYWKKWDCDPWTKVKKTSYSVAKESREVKLLATDSEVATAIAQIKACDDLEALKNVFGAIWTNTRHIAEHKDVTGEKNRRKDELEK